MVIYVGLIIAFTYFYTFVQVNPEQMAENLQKQGGYVPGIRPGKNTETYLTRSHLSFNFCRSTVLSSRFYLPDHSRQCCKPSSSRPNWRNKLTHRRRCRTEYDETAGEPVGKTTLPRLYKISFIRM